MDQEFVQAVKDLSIMEVLRIVRDNYDVVPITVNILPGWVDKNFQIKTLVQHETQNKDDGLNQAMYVLKVINTKESKEADFIDAQNAVMLHLRNSGVICCWPIRAKSGLYNSFYHHNERLSTTTSEGDKDPYLVRLMYYVPGRGLNTDGIKLTDDLLYQTGAFIASVTTCIQPCNKHIGLQSRTYSMWNLESVPLLRGTLSTIEKRFDQETLHMILEVLDNFDQNVVPQYNKFQRGLIHGDCNPGNIVLVNNNVTASGSAIQHTLGIIDFGEIANSFIMFELAVALAHFLILCQKSNVLSSVIKLREGFTAVIPLNHAELSALKDSVAARLIQCVVLSTWYLVNDEMTDEIRISNLESMALLKLLNNISA